MSIGGYHYCACRDCFELYVGLPGQLCSACVAADCQPDAECEAPHTYCAGSDGDDVDYNDPHPDCHVCGQPF